MRDKHAPRTAVAAGPACAAPLKGLLETPFYNIPRISPSIPGNHRRAVATSKESGTSRAVGCS